MYTVWDHIIQIGYNFFHVFCLLTGLLHLILRIPASLRIKGDQFLFTLWDFLLAPAFVWIKLLKFVVYNSTFAK